MPDFPRTTPVTVVITVPSGAVDVVAEERSSASVDVEPYDSREQSRELAEQTRVDMDGDTLRVTAPAHTARLLRRGGSVRVRVAVPLDSTARISAASADTTCRGRYATLALNGASCDVQVDHVTGDVTIKTASGDVRVDRVDGELAVDGASGTIDVGHSGRAVRANLASGTITIGDAAGDVRAKTASGDVRVDVARQGTVRVSTASGDVSVGVQAGTGVWLDLNAVSGRTHNGLAMAGTAPSTPNGHQLSVEARTVSGNIDVHRVG